VNSEGRLYFATFIFLFPFIFLKRIKNRHFENSSSSDTEEETHRATHRRVSCLVFFRRPSFHRTETAIAVSIQRNSYRCARTLLLLLLLLSSSSNKRIKLSGKIKGQQQRHDRQIMNECTNE
jgi:hypothetical protein